MKTIKEGSATIALSEDVFYNPRMKELRDLSVLFLKAVKAKGRLLDATSATGIRGIRYAKEVGMKDVVCLDINEAAYKNIKSNVKRNRLSLKVANTSIHEFTAQGRPDNLFDVIDLDPFGSPMPYLDDTLRMSNDGAILMITATDTAVLCGAHTKACIKLYGSKPMHNELCKESGIRILINYVIRAAARFNFGVEVLLSVSDRHYMRIFVRVKKGADAAVNSIKECGFATFCTKCHSFSYAKGLAPILIKNCTKCKAHVEGFGPMFLGRLYDGDLLKKMVHENVGTPVKFPEAGRQLQHIYNEFDTHFFYAIPKLTRNLKISSVGTDKLISALEKKKFKATRTQFSVDGIKTDASLDVILGCIKVLGREQKAKE